MLQSIDKKKIYLYFFLLLIFLSTHNKNSVNLLDNFFQIKKIVLNGNIEENLKNKIQNSLDKYYDLSIFSIKPNDLKSTINNFNMISEFRIKIQYPSSIIIDVKETAIIAYYIHENKKIYVGENGKKIYLNNDIKPNVPLIIGRFNIDNFLELKKKLSNNGFNFDDFVKFYHFKSERWDLVYKDKITIKLPIDNLENSIIILKELIENSNIQDVNIIDLRTKKNVIIS